MRLQVVATGSQSRVKLSGILKQDCHDILAARAAALKIRGQKSRPTTPKAHMIGDKNTSTSTERQKRSQNLAPVLGILSGISLVFSRKMITSTGFYRCCAPGALAPVVVKNQSPI